MNDHDNMDEAMDERSPSSSVEEVKVHARGALVDGPTEDLPQTEGTSSKPAKAKSQTTFIQKLYSIIENPDLQHLISWADRSNVFIVYDPEAFSKEVLPQYFKHNNWQSFVRQLNMYGFHKVNDVFHQNPISEAGAWEFKHRHFKSGGIENLPYIKRKSTRPSLSAGEPSASSSQRAGSSSSSSSSVKPIPPPISSQLSRRLSGGSLPTSRRKSLGKSDEDQNTKRSISGSQGAHRTLQRRHSTAESSRSSHDLGQMLDNLETRLDELSRLAQVTHDHHQTLLENMHETRRFQTRHSDALLSMTNILRQAESYGALSATIARIPAMRSEVNQLYDSINNMSEEVPRQAAPPDVRMNVDHTPSHTTNSPMHPQPPIESRGSYPMLPPLIPLPRRPSNQELARSWPSTQFPPINPIQNPMPPSPSQPQPLWPSPFYEVNPRSSSSSQSHRPIHPYTDQTGASDEQV